MKQGDFTALAKEYINRPGYSEMALSVIFNNIKSVLGKEDLVAADVGAGTGKLTENLANIGLTGYAVEPNDAMRTEGIRIFGGKETFKWSEGSAEKTGLPDNSVDLVLMGSSFHWTDAPVL